MSFFEMLLRLKLFIYSKGFSNNYFEEKLHLKKINQHTKAVERIKINAS